MPYALTPDNLKLYYEEVGQGAPILFVHEFAGDHRSWEQQLREFGKRYRCIAYAARGYKPSDVPDDPNAYSYRHVMRDAVAVLDHLKITQAHLIGLSMGGYTVLQVALNHSARVRSMVLAGTGSGSERWYTEEFHKRSRQLATQFEREGSAAVA
jgi:3-oxoadipate enol-lactonase